MKASELIETLQGLIKTYGDLNIIFEDEYTDYRAEVLDILIEWTPSGKNFNEVSEDSPSSTSFSS